MRRALLVLGLATFLGLLAVVIPVITPPEVLSGSAYNDPDDYTRLLRVRDLLESRDWYDGTIERANWPDGDTLHWTRAVDLVLVAAAALAAPVVGWEGGLRFAAVVVPPLALVAIVLASAWGAAALAGRAAWIVVPVFLAVQPAVLSYGRPGRPDHHAVILFCLALSVALLVRWMGDRAGRWTAPALGICVAVGLWASPEFLLPLGIFLVGGGGLWVWHGGPAPGFHLRWTAWMTVGLAAAIVLERGPGLGTIEFDRLSLVHLLVGVLAAAVWWVAGVWQQRYPASGPLRRALVLAAAGSAALGVMVLAFPDFFGGPMVAVTDPVARTWLGQVRELQPLLLPGSTARAGLLLIYAGGALATLPFLGLKIARGAEESRAFLLLAFGLVVSLGVSLAQLRWVTYVEILAATAVAAAVAAAGRHARSGGDRILRQGATLVLLTLAPLLAGAGLTAVAGTGPGFGSLGSTVCHDEAVARLLARDERWEGRTLTVAAHTDLGPVLLFRTHHRVWATPYHRNAAGIRKAYDLFAETDPERALDRARATRPDLLVLCPGRDEAIFPRTVEGDTTLYGRLARGRPPSWLEDVSLPDSLDPVRIFEVVRSN